MAVEVEKTDKKYPGRKNEDIIQEYDRMIEELRTRLNVLSTSLFLLHESTDIEDPKTKRYLNSVNQEMERIRSIISQYPLNSK